MTSKPFTMIFYIITEDLDEIEQPNGFGYFFFKSNTHLFDFYKEFT